MTLNELRIKPAPGRRVLSPATRKPLGEEGITLDAAAPEVTYWSRRADDGDVVISPIRAAKAAVAVAVANGRAAPAA